MKKYIMYAFLFYSYGIIPSGEIVSGGSGFVVGNVNIESFIARLVKKKVDVFILDAQKAVEKNNDAAWRYRLLVKKYRAQKMLLNEYAASFKGLLQRTTKLEGDDGERIVRLELAVDRISKDLSLTQRCLVGFSDDIDKNATILDWHRRAIILNESNTYKLLKLLFDYKIFSPEELRIFKFISVEKGEL